MFKLYISHQINYFSENLVRTNGFYRGRVGGSTFLTDRLTYLKARQHRSDSASEGRT